MISRRSSACGTKSTGASRRPARGVAFGRARRARRLRHAGGGGRSYTYFGLDHAATCWMGQANDGAAHNAVTDAIKSMQLFNLYVQVQHDEKELARLQGLLLSTPVAPSFAKKVRLAVRRAPRRGAPWTACPGRVAHAASRAGSRALGRGAEPGV